MGFSMYLINGFTGFVEFDIRGFLPKAVGKFGSSGIAHSLMELSPS
jgi:hypothetical protein